MQILVEEDMIRAFYDALAQAPSGEPLYVLSSYTAMWTLRRDLVQRGYLDPFWRQTELKPGPGSGRQVESVRHPDPQRSAAR